MVSTLDAAEFSIRAATEYLLQLLQRVAECGSQFPFYESTPQQCYLAKTCVRKPFKDLVVVYEHHSKSIARIKRKKLKHKIQNVAGEID